MPAKSNLASFVVIGVGGLFLYSGIKNVGISTAVRDFIKGDNPAKDAGTGSNPLGGTTSQPANIAPSGGQVSSDNAANKKLGRRFAKAFGWASGEEWTALNNLIMQESGWSNTAANPTSNARGIGQNINGFGPGYQENNPAQQIHWTYNYIKHKYGDPITAWQHEQAHGWY